MKEFVRKSSVRVIVCLLVALLAILPLANGTIPMGSDTSFHILRIQGVYEAMQVGEWMPGVLWNQNYGWGYGSPLFYSTFFLLIPAWFMKLGMGLIPAYRLFLFVIFFFQAFFMYGLAETIIKRDKASVLLSVLGYVFAAYCFSNLYNRGALGEALAAVFIPLALDGLYRILFSNNKGWMRLTWGLAGLLLSHNISFVLFCGTLVVLCLINIRKLLKKPFKIYLLCASAFLAFALTMWFSLGMIQQMQSGVYRINTYFRDPNALHETAVHFIDYIRFFPYDHAHMGLGYGLILTLLPAGVFFMKGKTERYKFIRQLAILGYASFVIMSPIFPWTLFPFMSFLQFPHRLYTLCAPFLSVCAGYVFAYFPLPRRDRSYIRMSVLAVALLFSLWEVNTQFNYRGSFHSSTTAEELKEQGNFAEPVDSWYNIMECSTPEYLPSDRSLVYSKMKRIIYHEDMMDSIFEEGEGWMSWGYDGGGIYLYPKTWYKGYQVDVKQGDTVLYSTMDTWMNEDTGEVNFRLPDGLPSDSSVVLTYPGTYTRRNLGKTSAILCVGIVAAQIGFWLRKKKNEMVI